MYALVGSSVAESCITLKAICKEVSCGLKFVADETEAEKPGSHCVFGIFVLLWLGACGSYRFCHLRKCEAKLNVAFELPGVDATLAVCRGCIELEKSELDGAFGEGGVEVQHMVSAVVVVLISAVVAAL